MKNDTRFFVRWFLIGMIMIGMGASSRANTATVDRIVDVYGQLSVSGNKIVDQHGNPVVLRGMSLFWSQWIGKYYNSSCISWLHTDWQCNVVRAALAVESGGYLTNPDVEKAKVKAVIDACVNEGIYVIVDWHDHNAHLHTAQAITFFTEIASEYGDLPNIIYEIYNEPTQVSWPNIIKPYADSVITEIRAIDPDNIIIVGTPTWSQDVDIAAAAPLTGTNLAYALHYYAATHKQSLRNKATTALNRGAALWVTEFGTCESSGSGVLDSAETRTWWDYLEANQISWCNWSIADKVETSAALVPNASATGGWSASDLTTSGAMVRNKIITMNEAITSVNETPGNPGGSDFRLVQNYPNPFNPSTTIEFSIPKSGRVRLSIYTILGTEVATLIDGNLTPGSHQAVWNAAENPSGVYYYRLRAGNIVKTGKMALVK